MISSGMTCSWVKGSPGIWCIKKKVTLATRNREKHKILILFARKVAQLVKVVLMYEIRLKKKLECSKEDNFSKEKFFCIGFNLL